MGRLLPLSPGLVLRASLVVNDAHMKMPRSAEVASVPRVVPAGGLRRAFSRAPSRAPARVRDPLLGAEDFFQIPPCGGKQKMIQCNQTWGRNAQERGGKNG